MHDGLGYVLAAYGVVGVTLGLWFAMIIRRMKITREDRSDG